MLDSGELYICTLEETQSTGEMPAERLVPEEDARAYERRRIGYGRIYAAKGADERVDAVFRIWDDLEDTVHPDMYALTDTGIQYHIAHVQPTEDDHGIPVLDLTLDRVGENYDVAEPET